MNKCLDHKSTGDALSRLEDLLGRTGKIAVAFSGGVDSSVVLAAAGRALGNDSVLAITARSQTYPRRELEAASGLAAALSIRHLVIDTCELEDENFRANPQDRCYHCKRELWGRAGELARDMGFSSLADGVNADDIGDHRPGIKASDEAGVIHPLVQIGAGKAEVRAMGRELGLPNWDKPAQACLSSRFPYGQPISETALKRVEAAEEFLQDLGLVRLRVRDHGGIARIEVPLEAQEGLVDSATRLAIVRRLKELGFTYVTLDLEGFRSGSMNETL